MVKSIEIPTKTKYKSIRTPLYVHIIELIMQRFEFMYSTTIASWCERHKQTQYISKADFEKEGKQDG